MYEIKKEPKDFLVEEITPDKDVLEKGKKYKLQKSSGDQLVCVLEKENWDTNLVIRGIAKRLYVSQKRVGFAGTKDKRAITTQRISLWKIKENVADLRMHGVSIKPLYYSDKRVELGDLWGNRFTIKIYTDKKLGRIPKKIPNLFGEQRFGAGRKITHLVGKEILKEDLETAVKMYLGQSSSKESPETREARERLAKDWDFKEALEYFPNNLRFERSLLGHLSQYPNDYVGALRKLPKFLKIMFVHAYQAHLFNMFVKECIKKKRKFKTGPLYGFESKMENQLERNILKKEKTKLSDFHVRSMPEMSSKGSRRPVYVGLKDFKILKKTKSYYTIRFSLPKGCYATTVIDYLFGNNG
jgi:tRNA pseudouridine13 synthase